MKYNPKDKGFTLMEITLVIGLFAALTAGAGIGLSRFFTQNQLQEYGIQITQSVRRAQSFAMARYYDSEWGMALNPIENQATLFRGTSFTARNPAFDEVISLPSILVLENISFAGGRSEIIFNRVTGETNQSGFFELRDETTDDTMTFTINRYGQIETGN